MKNKKGNYNIFNLGAIGITLLVVGIILAITPYILSSIQDTTESSTSSIALNRSGDITAVNATIVAITAVSAPDSCIVGDIVVYNQSTGSVIAGGTLGSATAGNWSFIEAVNS